MGDALGENHDLAAVPTSKEEESAVCRSELEGFLQLLPRHLIERVWPSESVLLGKCVCKWLLAEVSRLEFAWAINPGIISRQPTIQVCLHSS